MAARWLVSGVLLVVLLAGGDRRVSGEPPKPTGRVLVDVRADGKPVSAALELVTVLDLSTLGRDQVSVGQLSQDILDRALTGAGKVVASARTNSAGRAELTGIARGIHALRIRGGPGGDRSAVFVLPASGATLRVLVDTSRGTETVKGRIVLEKGASFSGCVRLTGSATSILPFQLGTWHAPVRVPADGSFTLKDVPVGLYDLAAIDDERGVVGRHQFSAGSGYEPEVHVFPRRSYVLEGQVTAEDTGKPVAGAHVRLRSQRHAPEHVETGADGRFHVEADGHDTSVVVEAPGYAPGESKGDWPPYMDAASQDVVTLGSDVVLQRAVTVSGRLTRADGHGPVADLPVAIMSIPEPGPMVGLVPQLGLMNMMRGIRVRIATSGRRGEFSADGLAPGRYLVGTNARDWVSRNLTDPGLLDDLSALAELAPGAHHRVELELVRTAAIEGRVRAADGTGLEGVVLVASSAGFDEVAGSSHATVSGAGGAYRIDGVLPGHPCVVSALSLDHAPAVAAPLTPEPGRTAHTDLTLPDAAWIDVRLVLGPKKEARAGVIVTVGPEEKTPDTERMRVRAVTDRDGRAHLGPLPHKMLLTLRSLDPELGMHTEPLPAIHAGGTYPCELDVGADKILAGRLVGLPPGAKPEDVELSAADDGLGIEDGHGAVNADGTFRWVLFTQKHVRLSAVLRQQGVLYHGEIDAQAGSWDLRLPLSRVRADGRDGNWLIRVRGPDGRDVPRADVARIGQYERPDAQGPVLTTRFDRASMVVDGLAWQRPGSRGPFTLPREDVPERRTWFCVYGARDAEGKPLPFGAVVIGPYETAGGTLEARMPRERRITGRCVDAAGRPVAGVTISAWPWTWETGGPQPGVPSLSGDGVHAYATSDEKGAFALAGLGALPYRLVPQAPEGYLPLEARVLDERAATADYRLTLGATVALTFLGPDGKPLEGVHVTVDPFEGSHPDLLEQGVPFDEALRRTGFGARRVAIVQGETDAQGKVTLRGLKPGALYNLSAHDWGHEPKLTDIDRVKWKPAPETFRFESDRTELHGKVLTPDGKPLPNAYVWYLSAGWGGWQSLRAREEERQQRFPRLGGTTDEPHVFRIGLLDAGECFLWVTMDPQARPPERADRARWTKEVVRAGGGPAEVVLRCEPGPGLFVEVPDYHPGFTSLNVLLQDLTTPDADAREHVETRASTVFYGVKADRRYVVYALTSDGKRCGVARDVRPSSTPLRLKLGPAGRAHGSITLPEGLHRHEVLVVAVNADGIALGGKLDPDGMYEIAGLSDEPWTVTAWVEKDGVLWIAEHVLQKPGGADLVLHEER